MQQLNLLAAARVNRLLGGLQDPRLRPQELVWNRRIPNVPAADEEITARFVGQVQIADMIAEDARGVIYSMGRFQLESTKIPKIKVGIGMNETTLSQLERLANGYGSPTDNMMFRRWQANAIAAVNLGVQQRIEQLKVAMLCDGIGFAYDRLGIKLTNPTWGLPPELKITVATGWENPGTATPVSDIQVARLVANQRWGVDLDRVTMSMGAFRAMIATTEFQNKARQWLAPNVSYVNLTLSDITQQRAIAQNVLGIEIETYDAQYWTQTAAGVISSARFLPINNVVLTSKAFDGRQDVWDFANGQVMESVVARLGPTTVVDAGGLAGGFGPLAYVTTADPALNPPGLVHWGVARGFPRKHMVQASAVLQVGNVVDPVSTTVVFPA